MKRKERKSLIYLVFQDYTYMEVARRKTHMGGRESKEVE